MTVQSKLSGAFCTCQEFQHAWTDKCVNASVGLLLASTPYCLRIYSMVYVLSMVMRHKIPTLQDLRRMVMGILQSTAFLVTNAYTFIMYNCLIRHLLGRYYMATVAFVPCFLASLSAIVVERPQRRPLLALYVANVATETLWNMAEARGYVRSIPKGQVLIFGASVSALLYLYRLGLHKGACKDSLFDILRIFVGKAEEGNAEKLLQSDSSAEAPSPQPTSRSRPPVNLTTIQGYVQIYARLIEKLKSKHASCPHKMGCISYALKGGAIPLLGGIGMQVALKLVMNLKKIAQNKMDWRKTVFNRQTLNLGLFLGSFSFLYKSSSCALRHCFNRDDPRYALLAGPIASLSFLYNRSVTVALYVMWKALQILYNLGIQRQILPHVPGFTIFLYCFSTSVLFNATILEPLTIRRSYYTFLELFSGERISKFNVKGFDVFGLETSKAKEELLRSLKIVEKKELPWLSLNKWLFPAPLDMASIAMIRDLRFRLAL